MDLSGPLRRQPSFMMAVTASGKGDAKESRKNLSASILSGATLNVKQRPVHDFNRTQLLPNMPVIKTSSQLTSLGISRPCNSNVTRHDSFSDNTRYINNSKRTSRIDLTRYGQSDPIFEGLNGTIDMNDYVHANNIDYVNSSLRSTMPIKRKTDSDSGADGDSGSDVQDNSSVSSNKDSGYSGDRTSNSSFSSTEHLADSKVRPTEPDPNTIYEVVKPVPKHSDNPYILSNNKNYLNYNRGPLPSTPPRSSSLPFSTTESQSTLNHCNTYTDMRIVTSTSNTPRISHSHSAGEIVSTKEVQARAILYGRTSAALKPVSVPVPQISMQTKVEKRNESPEKPYNTYEAVMKSYLSSRNGKNGNLSPNVNDCRVINHARTDSEESTRTVVSQDDGTGRHSHLFRAPVKSVSMDSVASVLCDPFTSDSNSTDSRGFHYQSVDNLMVNNMYSEQCPSSPSPEFPPPPSEEILRKFQPTTLVESPIETHGCVVALTGIISSQHSQSDANSSITSSNYGSLSRRPKLSSPCSKIMPKSVLKKAGSPSKRKVPTRVTFSDNIALVAEAEDEDCESLSSDGANSHGIDYMQYVHDLQRQSLAVRLQAEQREETGSQGSSTHSIDQYGAPAGQIDEPIYVRLPVKNSVVSTYIPQKKNAADPPNHELLSSGHSNSINSDSMCNLCRTRPAASSSFYCDHCSCYMLKLQTDC